MKHIIHEIRNQPHHIRELATILCTIAVVAVVVLVWFNSFQRDIYTMLNPDLPAQAGQESEAQDKLFVQESKSLFGSILQVFSDGKAQIYNLFSGQGNQSDIVNPSAPKTNNPSGASHPLPVSGNR